MTKGQSIAGRKHNDGIEMDKVFYELGEKRTKGRVIWAVH